MFSLKFYLHNDDSYVAYSCERYSVTLERDPPDANEAPEDAPMISVVRMFRTLDDDNPYYETIGDRQAHGHAFVVNAAGKTIDTIR